MYGKWQSLRELQKGLELSLTASIFGIPEVLVVHEKYEKPMMRILNDFAKHKLNASLAVIITDPETCCSDCAGYFVRAISEDKYPGASTIVNVKYFGLSQDYIDGIDARMKELSS